MAEPLKVLLVEDSADDAFLALRELRRGGFEPVHELVETAADMQAALDRGGWELIISDHGMSQFSSGAALRLVQDRHLDIPFIIVSGTIGEEQAVAAMKAGAHDYIIKGHLSRLVPAIQRELREAGHRRQRRVAEQHLRESEELFRGLFENSRDAIVTMEPPTWKFASGNPAAVKLFGFTNEGEFISRAPWELSPERQPDGSNSAEQAREIIATVLRDGFHSFEWTHRRSGGEEFKVEVVLTRMERSGGVFLQAIIRDITARKQAENLLRESHRQLEAALSELRATQRQIIEQENMRALGQMASGIAHDFNNAIAPIMGFTELLLQRPERLADQQRVAKTLQIIQTCAHDATSVVRRMREFSRKRAAREVSQNVDLNAVIRQTIELTQPRWLNQTQAAGRTIKVVAALQPVPAITGEEFALRELLTNLIFNAVDALPEGGTITLRTAVDGEFVCIQVSDTGTGMTEEVRRRCLEPFFTTKGDNGTGLGLSMVHGIVERYHGTLDVASQLGQGTTFAIRFPVRQTEKKAAEHSPVKALPQSLRVLVVDDEDLLRTIVEALLLEDGHGVVTVANGAAALAQLQHNAFDLVITDKAMAEMNGEQLAVAIHARQPNLPVILMSGFGDLMKADGVLPPQVQAILSKPITQAGLREVLAKVFPAK